MIEHKISLLSKKRIGKIIHRNCAAFGTSITAFQNC